VDLDTVADELYAQPREEFIATRDARAKQARAAGRRDLAAAIGKLRKPTSAAWMVNLLAREQPDEVRGLVELGEALRAAHGTLDGAALQQLSRRRHQVVHALVRQARSLARKAGYPASEAVAREVEATIVAALTDPAAARELAAGRLATSLSITDLGEPDWFGDTTAAQPAHRRRSPDPAPGTRSEQDERRDAARRELKAAREESAKADAAREASRCALAEAEDRAREAAEAVRLVEEQLEAAERMRDRWERESDDARRTLHDAEERAQKAEQRVDDLERAVRLM